MKENIAPVLIATVNRYEHLKNCIYSLQQCELATETHLFVALDYPPTKEYVEGFLKIKSFLKRVTGFKEVTVIERQENFGTHKNIRAAMAHILEKYKNIIFTEDDNEFSQDFLLYLNAGLCEYEHNEKVFSICGYGYPIELEDYNNDVYFYNGFSAWGYATWKEKYQKVDWSIDKLEIFISNKNNLKKISSKVLLKNLRKMVKTRKVLGDAYLCYHQARYGMVSVFPVISRVRNHGHDGSGVNGGNSSNAREIYTKQPIYEGNDDYSFYANDVESIYVKKSIDGLLNPNKIYFYIKHPINIFDKLKNFYKKYI